MRSRSRWLISLSVLVGITILLLSGPTLKRFEFTEPHMGTRFRIVLYASDEDSAKEACRAAFRRIAQLDDNMSDYDPDSELMRLAARAGTGPVRINADLFHILSQSQQLASMTEGAFDVTIGPLVRLWRRARQDKKMPNLGALTQARDLVGFKKMQLNPKASTAELFLPGMQLDLGGIAKGYAADKALEVLKDHGMTRALVDAGGDVVLGLPPPRRDGWKIRIAPLGPFNSLCSSESQSARNLILHGVAVATSGDAEQFVEIDGKRYSHVLDPRTGQFTPGSSGTTVIASSGSLADSLATAVSVLGPKRGMELVKSFRNSGALIMENGDNTLRTFEVNFPTGLGGLPLLH